MGDGAEKDACPDCGGREWATASDGLGDVASVAATCLACGFLTTSTVSLASVRCDEHYDRHPDLPHLVAVCALPLGHEGEHSNVLPKSLTGLLGAVIPSDVPTPSDREERNGDTAD